MLTGAAGYIGSMVTMALLQRGFRVLGVDNLSFGSRSLATLISYPSFEFEKLDLTNFEAIQKLISNRRPDHVVHLAAIVGDPACKAQPELARKVNLLATQHLYESCAGTNVKRFVFASTCSNYGLSAGDELLSEDSPLNPVSLYAECKVAAEEWLLNHATSGPQAFVLRFSTAHGLSPRMRFDLTVNEFTKVLLEGLPLDLYDAATWRPYCHVVDFGRVISQCLSSESLNATSYVLNVGSDTQNFRKLDIVDKISAHLPPGTARIKNLGDGKDRRNYRVSFKKLIETLAVTPIYTVDETIISIGNALRAGVFQDGRAIYANV